ncbi:MAG TPA: hypothetical protein VNF05_02355 [Acidimicrobiales bacterium]|nr:hypothetical protein [Acidimicrobiales bacterium]
MAAVAIDEVRLIAANSSAAPERRAVTPRHGVNPPVTAVVEKCWALRGSQLFVRVACGSMLSNGAFSAPDAGPLTPLDLFSTNGRSG